VTPFVRDADFTLYVGDVLETLRELPAESVQSLLAMAGPGVSTPLMIAEELYFSTYNTTNTATVELLRKAGARPTPANFVTNTGIRSSEVWYEPGCEPATLGSEGKCRP